MQQEARLEEMPQSASNSTLNRPVREVIIPLAICFICLGALCAVMVFRCAGLGFSDSRSGLIPQPASAGTASTTTVEKAIPIDTDPPPTLIQTAPPSTVTVPGRPTVRYIYRDHTTTDTVTQTPSSSSSGPSSTSTDSGTSTTSQSTTPSAQSTDPQVSPSP